LIDLPESDREFSFSEEMIIEHIFHHLFLREQQENSGSGWRGGGTGSAILLNDDKAKS
jgi:hypothetical protein